MRLQASYFKKVFRFNFNARTSRGLMTDKTSWFIKIWNDVNPEIIGWGECGPLPGLSPDAPTDFEAAVQSVIKVLIESKNISTTNSDLILQEVSDIVPPQFPSIVFGVETALLDLAHGGRGIIFDNDFCKGARIPINGLIWMGDQEFMLRQIDQKIAQGFRCIKLKVGGLDFDQECQVLQRLRKKYSNHQIVLRLDANGAFNPDESLFKLQQLKKFDVHSIEQPIKPGLPEMEELCRKSPIPIALDEELIGVATRDRKSNLLSHLKPQFITLKPTLHGGFSGCREWIGLASDQGIGWWITSALESNIGLNAICQFTAGYPVAIPQGLGTGAIYEENFQSPLRVEGGNIFMDANVKWNIKVP